MNDTHRYDDIIDLPHHQSARRPHMSALERAAQFSPFAALTGYGAIVTETARLTDRRIELNDEAKDEIDRTLRSLLDRAEEAPVAAFTYFEPDARKEGGRYVTALGTVRRYDGIEGQLVLIDGRKIPVRELLRVEEIEAEE